MKYIVVLIALAALITGGWYLTRQADNSATNQAEVTNTPTGETKQPASVTEPAPAQSQPGAYVDYSSSVITATKGTKILFFHAPWCPQCRALEADIKANTIPDGVTIIKTDYDTNQALRQKYGVTIQTTLVKVDDNGNLVEKYVAYDSPTLAALKASLL